MRLDRTGDSVLCRSFVLMLDVLESEKCETCFEAIYFIDFSHPAWSVLHGESFQRVSYECESKQGRNGRALLCRSDQRSFV